MAGRDHWGICTLQGTGHKCHVTRTVLFVLSDGCVFLLLAIESSEGHCFRGHCWAELGKGQEHSWMRCKDSELLA